MLLEELGRRRGYERTTVSFIPFSFILCCYRGKKSSGKLECFTFQVCHSNHLILSCLKYCVKDWRGGGGETTGGQEEG